MIDGIIFDKDGTLFDFRLSWTDWASRALADLAPEAERRALLAEALGFDLARGAFSSGSLVVAATTREVAQAAAPLLPGMSVDEIEDRMNARAAENRMFEAAPLIPLLSGLKARGLRLGLATNDAEAAAEEHLRAHGVRDFFDFVAGYDSGYGAKPAPGQLSAFAERFRLEPRRVAMVGDTLHDLEAAAAAGLRGVGVLTGVLGREALAPRAEVVLADVSGLPAWLDGLAA